MLKLFVDGQQTISHPSIFHSHLESTSEAGESKWCLYIDVIVDHTQIGSCCLCTQIGSGDFAIGHRWLPKLPCATSDAFFGVVRCLGSCASIFSKSNGPPLRNFLRVLRSKNPVFCPAKAFQPPHNLIQTTSNCSYAVILLATSLRNIAEVTRPQGFVFLKKVQSCIVMVQ